MLRYYENMDMKIIDLHCDTILRCCMWTKALRDYPGQISLEKLQKGGCLAQCFALFIPTHDACRFYFGEDREPGELYHTLLKCYKENMAACADAIRPALTAEDILKNAESGFISSILTISCCLIYSLYKSSLSFCIT